MPRVVIVTGVALGLVLFAVGGPFAQTSSVAIDWRDALKQSREWYGSAEAARIAGNVLLYQRNSGGWPKNINMAAVLTPQEKKTLIEKKTETDSTIRISGVEEENCLAKKY